MHLFSTVTRSPGLPAKQTSHVANNKTGWLRALAKWRLQLIILFVLLCTACIPFFFSPPQLLRERSRSRARMPAAEPYGVMGGVQPLDVPLSFSFEAATFWPAVHAQLAAKQSSSSTPSSNRNSTSGSAQQTSAQPASAPASPGSSPQAVSEPLAHGVVVSPAVTYTEAYLEDGPFQEPDEATVDAAGFNWRMYLLRNADLRAKGIRTAGAAYRHYLEKGRAMNRPHTRFPLLLRYSACQGLFNQMYAHLSAFILADLLDADVVLPPSLYRPSFNKHFSMDLSHNEVTWEPAPAGHLLDVDHIRSKLGGRGRQVQLTPRGVPMPDCNQPEAAFPQYVHPGTYEFQIAMLPDIYLASLPVDTLWDRAARAVMDQHASIVALGVPENEAGVILDLPSPFFSLMTQTCLERAQRAAELLRFNSTLVAMAARVRDGMAAASGSAHGAFNGVHLRIERDAEDWLAYFGGSDGYLSAYAAAMQRAGFGSTHAAAKAASKAAASAGAPQQPGAAGAGSSGSGSALDDGSTGGTSSGGGGGGAQEGTRKSDSSGSSSTGGGLLGLYVASGMFAYVGGSEMDALMQFLAPFGSRVHYKELYVPKEELAQLNPEQQALLDFLVLVEAQSFVGLSSSTFSVFLKEYRKLHGHTGRYSNELVRATAVGTDLMFTRCTHFNAG